MDYAAGPEFAEQALQGGCGHGEPSIVHLLPS
jgi:hypothetical protein